MSRAHAQYAAQESDRRFRARQAAQADELLTNLLNAAFSVLHHDTADGTDAGAYMRKTLRKKFARILKIRVG